MDKVTVISKIEKNPVLAGYSAKRYLAAIDVGRNLSREGMANGSEMRDAWFSLYSKSPYVPDTKRQRLSQVRRLDPQDTREPPLMWALRKRTDGNANRKQKVIA